MEAHEYYKKETGKLYYKEASLELELTDDYINWLERNVVKLFAINDVVGRSEQLVAYTEIERRQQLIMSEPDGVVRETMIANLLVGLQ